MPGLSADLRERYKRHLMLPQVGEEGQLKLLSSRVLVVGAGGLGSPVLQYLAAAGVGHIGIVDADVVDLSNLQRQVLHSAADLGRPKVLSASEKISATTPGVDLQLFQTRLSADNASQIFSGYDFVVDCVDNFSSKYLINDVCVSLGLPFSHGAIREFYGEAFTYVPGSPCYRCLFPEPDSSRPFGVLGAVPGVIGCIQALEALKFLTSAGDLLTGRLLTVDLLSMQFSSFSFSRNLACPVCGGGHR